MEDFLSLLNNFFLLAGNSIKSVYVDISTLLINKIENHYYNYKITNLEKEKLFIMQDNIYLKNLLNLNAKIQEDFIINFPEVFWKCIFLLLVPLFIWFSLKFILNYFFKELVSSSKFLSFLFKNKVKDYIAENNKILDNIDLLKQNKLELQNNLEMLNDDIVKFRNQFEKNFVENNSLNEITGETKMLCNSFINEFNNLINNNSNKIYSDEDVKNTHKFFYKQITIYNILIERLVFHSNGITSSFIELIKKIDEFNKWNIQIREYYPLIVFKEYLEIARREDVEKEIYQPIYPTTFLEKFYKLAAEFPEMEISEEEALKKLNDCIYDDLKNYIPVTNPETFYTLNNSYFETLEHCDKQVFEIYGKYYNNCVYFFNNFKIHYENYVEYTRLVISHNKNLKSCESLLDNKEFLKEKTIGLTGDMWLINEYYKKEHIDLSNLDNKKYKENNLKLIKEEIPAQTLTISNYLDLNNQQNVEYYDKFKFMSSINIVNDLTKTTELKGNYIDFEDNKVYRETFTNYKEKWGREEDAADIILGHSLEESYM